MSHATVCILSTVVVTLMSSVAGAQSAQPLLLEVARDPGRADAPLTARALALGGARTPSGSAGDALANPSGLVLMPGRRNVIGSIGWFRFGRDELVATPPGLPPLKPQRLRSPPSVLPVGYAAAAVRGSNWAGAGFYDATARVNHAFTTTEEVLRNVAIPGVRVETRGSGAARFELSTTRIGGTIALGTRSQGAGVGVAVYGVGLSGTIASTIDGVARTVYYPPYTPSDTSLSWDEDNRVELSGWRPGVAVSGLAKAGDHVVLSGRWRREPKFLAERRVRRRNSRDGLTDATMKAVEYQLPSVIAASATVNARSTTVVGEFTWTGYSAAYGPMVDNTPIFSFCERQQSTSCPGWGFHDYRLRDSAGVRAGVEREITAGQGTLFLRGGVTFDRSYTAARPAMKPFASAPVPAIPTPFTPPREHVWVWSAGAAYRARLVELSVGCAWTKQHTRCLADTSARF